MAKVTISGFKFLTIVTISAFCLGLTLQHKIELHLKDNVYNYHLNEFTVYVSFLLEMILANSLLQITNP